MNFDLGTRVVIKATNEIAKIVKIEGTTYHLDNEQVCDRKQLDYLQLKSWFISPINKHLCGDEPREYISGQVVTAVKANSTRTRWIVKIKNGQSYLIDRDFIDTYFVKHHLDNTMTFLNEF